MLTSVSRTYPRSIRIRPEDASLGLLKFQRLDHLLAGDLAHLRQHASDRPALELADCRHPPGGRPARVARFLVLREPPAWRHRRGGPTGGRRIGVGPSSAAAHSAVAWARNACPAGGRAPGVPELPAGGLGGGQLRLSSSGVPDGGGAAGGIIRDIRLL